MTTTATHRSPATPFAARRADFPLLAANPDLHYLDSAATSQKPRAVLDAIVHYYSHDNANPHRGAYALSARATERYHDARARVAKFVGVRDVDRLIFTRGTTESLNLVASAWGRANVGAGDEIVVTGLEHHANFVPWQQLALAVGARLRVCGITHDGRVDLDQLRDIVGARTKVVAFGHVSNAVGTINPVGEIVRRAHAAGALAWIDAVAFAPHGSIDVRALDVDFLVSSSYKWYGPHLAAVYGRAAILEQLPAYKVRPAHDRFETGTGAFESIAGAGAAVEHLARLGDRFGAAPVGATRRERLVAGMAAIREHELGLHARLFDGLRAIPGVRILGIADPGRFEAEKVPTISVTIDGVAPRDAAAALGRRGILAWDGDFYAQSLIERLGLFERGGVLRLGIAHYNTAGEIDRLLDALEGIAARPASAATAS